MDMLKAYGPHKLAEITVRDIANKRRKKNKKFMLTLKIHSKKRKCTGE